MLKIKKLKRSFVLLLAIIMMLTTNLNVLAVQHKEITIKKGEKLEYAPGYGWTTSKLTADGDLTYCLMPDKPVPPDGTYSTSSGNLKKLTPENTKNYSWYAKALYYCYGGGGFTTESTAFKTDPSKHEVSYIGNNCKVFMNNLKYSHYGFEMLKPSGSELWYLLTHRVLAYISGYSNWAHSLPSQDWRDVIKELANAIKKAPDIPPESELYILNLGSSYQQIIIFKDAMKIQLQKTSTKTEITDDNSCYSLAGAEYSIYLDKACTDYFGKMTTDENGFATYGKNVSDQNYYIKETKAPLGYTLNNTVYSIKNATLKEDKHGIKIYTFNVTDAPKTNSISVILNKIDEETGLPNKALKDAEFTIKYYKGYYDTAEQLEGVAHTRSWVIKTGEFGVLYLNPKFFVEGDMFYYDSLGIPTLPLGTISIQETKAPEGYEINEELFIRQIKFDEATEQIETYNPPTVLEKVGKGGIELTKIDSINKTPLEGAVYGLYSGNATTIQGKIDPKYKISDFTTNAEGLAILNDLKYGTYKVQEITPPTGYQISLEIYEINISEKHNIVKITAEDAPNSSNIKISKTSEDKNVKDIYFNISSPFKDYGNNKTDEHGIFYVGALPVYDLSGNKITYTVTELGELQDDGTYKLPDRYNTPKPQKITLELGKIATVKFNNTLKIGSLTLTKTDGNKKPLKGAEFKIYFADGKEIKVTQNGNGKYMYSTKGAYTTLKTSSIDAKMFISHLPQGNYYLVETKPPIGYMPYGEKLYFTISADKEETLKISSEISDNKLLLYNTGGNGNIQIYIISMILLVSGTLLVFVKYKKRGNENE